MLFMFPILDGGCRLLALQWIISTGLHVPRTSLHRKREDLDSHRVGEITVQSKSRSWCALIWVFYCMFLYFYRYCQKPVCLRPLCTVTMQQTFISQLEQLLLILCILFHVNKLFIFLLITFSWVVFSCLSVLSIFTVSTLFLLSWLYFLIPYALSIIICTWNRVRKFPTPFKLHKYKVKI